MKIYTATPVVTLFLLLFSLLPATVAQPAPPISGIKIVDYQPYVLQRPGTTATYWMEVENIGLLELSHVYVSVSRIPTDWLKKHESIALQFGERGRLYYDITIPASQVDYVVYSLDVYGEYGQLKESDSKPVMINMTSATNVTNVTAITTTATTATTTSATIAPTTTTIASKAASETVPIANVTMPQLPYADVIIEKLAYAWENWTLQIIASILFLLIIILAIVRLN